MINLRHVCFCVVCDEQLVNTLVFGNIRASDSVAITKLTHLSQKYRPVTATQSGCHRRANCCASTAAAMTPPADVNNPPVSTIIEAKPHSDTSSTPVGDNDQTSAVGAITSSDAPIVDAKQKPDPDPDRASDPDPTMSSVDRDGDESESQPQQSVFSGWGFDVNSVTNSVTNNMTSILSATGETVGGLGGLFGTSLGTTTSAVNKDDAEHATSSTSDLMLDSTVSTVSAGSGATALNGGDNQQPSTTTTENNMSESGDNNMQHDIEGEDIGAAAAHIANAAGAELEHASRAAQETLGKAAQELGRGWGTLNSFLDDMLAPEVGGSGGVGKGGDQGIGGLHADGSQTNGARRGLGGGSGGSTEHGNGLADLEEMTGNVSKGDVNVLFRALFPHLGAGAKKAAGGTMDGDSEKQEGADQDEEEEEVVDHYGCCMVQKYRCYLNNATPERSFVLYGRLFVTMSNVAMYVTDDGGAFGRRSAFGVNIPFEEIVKIQKGAKNMLRVVTKAQTSFIFGQFESDTHYAGALSLLEQLCAAAAGVHEQAGPLAAQAQAAAPVATSPAPAAVVGAAETKDVAEQQDASSGGGGGGDEVTTASQTDT